ncbi:Gfo/Idh/MocA family oxidoreductase [Saliphagus sp. GCM10025308]
MTDRAVGYVGLDHHHAEPYLQTLDALQAKATVTCACEPNPAFDLSTVDSLGDVPIYDSLEALLSAESVDTVFLTLPNRDTPDAIERALDAGVDVYTEKPAARQVADLGSCSSEPPLPTKLSACRIRGNRTRSLETFVDWSRTASSATSARSRRATSPPSCRSGTPTTSSSTRTRVAVASSSGSASTGSS